MANILIINHGLEKSGYGQAGRDLVKAFNRSGHNIIARAIKPNPDSSEYELDNELKEIYNKSIKNIDITFQHVLPHLFSGHSSTKNIGYLIVESENWWQSRWNRYVNLLDEIWVTNIQTFESIKKNKVNIPTKILPHACDITKYVKKYDKVIIPKSEGNFKFYSICEFGRRKRLSAIIEAFHLAFNRSDPVSLILKSYKSGHSPEVVANEIRKTCEDIKSTMKLYPNNKYNEELIITDYISEEQLCALHQDCDCYVSASYGEAWDQPLFDAMGFGNQCISPNFLAPSDYLNGYLGGHLIDGELIPIIGMNETFQNLNSGRELWCSINPKDLAEKMREIYLNKSEKNNSSNIIKDYSYENVGNHINYLLKGNYV